MSEAQTTIRSTMERLLGVIDQLLEEDEEQGDKQARLDVAAVARLVDVNAFYGISEAAKILEMPYRTVLRAVNDGSMRAWRNGRRILIPGEAIAARLIQAAREERELATSAR